MQLLIVPLVLTVGAFLFDYSLNVRRQETEERRAEAQVVADDLRAQEERLQAHLEEMGTLLIEEELLDSEEDDEVHYLERVRTLAVLREADEEQKRIVASFLLLVRAGRQQGHRRRRRAGRQPRQRQPE